ncbi:MAG: helix-turn-helix domain-containing protein [Eisenbergiella massiliensis]
MALSENIKARRTQLKMSQEYVADQLGISRQAVAKWEAGTSEPTSKNLSELAFLFEISISELVDPQTYAEEQAAQEQKFRDKQQNAKMLFWKVGWCHTAKRWLGRLFFRPVWYRLPVPVPLVSHFDGWSCIAVYHIKGYGEKA